MSQRNKRHVGILALTRSEEKRREEELKSRQQSAQALTSKEKEDEEIAIVPRLKGTGYRMHEIDSEKGYAEESFRSLVRLRKK